MEDEDGDLTVDDTTVFEGDLTILFRSLRPAIFEEFMSSRAAKPFLAVDGVATSPFVKFADVTTAPTPVLALVFPLPLARAVKKENTVFF